MHAAAAPAQNNAKPAGNKVTAKGSSTANLSASTKNASPIHSRLKKKYPKPNHQALIAAAFGPLAASISQTKTGRVINSTGQKKTGANDSTLAAPAVNAKAHSRQPWRDFTQSSVRI